MYQQLIGYIGKVHASKVGAYLGLGNSLAKQLPKIAGWGLPVVILGGWMIKPALK